MVRVRFAPSPTGFPHIGNIRTALFNWLFARHHRGSFILRIEDTDVERRVPGAVEAILDSLRWLGLDWDEGPGVNGPYAPYIQSGRLPFYKDMGQKLLESGQAYLCFCSPERLQQMRQEQTTRKQPPGYDRHCRELSVEERQRLVAQGITPVLRFRTPLAGVTSFSDVVWGEVSFQNSTLDDFVLLKSDGYPTYHLANVSDDHAMAISHVLRAEEWLASTPRHLLLYQALGFSPPQFAHLPMILGRDRAKLSKRHGATSATEFKEGGYLPEAMVNFLALLGWALDEKTELFSRRELVEAFSLERVGKTPAVFDLEKLSWMNGMYMRKLSLEDFVAQALPFWERDLPSEVKRPLERGYLLQMAPFIQERARTLAEVASLSQFFFEEPDYPAQQLLSGKGMDAEKALPALEAAVQKIAGAVDFTAESLESLFRPLAQELGLSTGAFFGLLRVAVTGRTASPPLFHTLAILGQKRCLARLEAAHRKLEA